MKPVSLQRFALRQFPAVFTAAVLALAGASASAMADVDFVAAGNQAFIQSAANSKRADLVYKSWIDIFLVHDGANIYFGKTRNNKQQTDGWIGATDTMVASDVFERTHSRAQQQFVSDLVNSFLTVNKTDWWANYGWNDDIAWIAMAQLRAYQTTAEQRFLDGATSAWNITYNKGWDTKSGNGGIWELMGDTSKCGLSNSPLVTVGAALHQITGDGAYLTKAEGIYAWVRANLFNASTGQVYGCMVYPNFGATGLVDNGNPSNNVYDSGSFLEAATSLYRVTGNTQYRDDALLAINHVVGPNRDTIVSRSSQPSNQWSYYFMRGLTQFCTLTKTCSEYGPWMRKNAKAAWANRDADNLTWDDWNHKTDFSDPDALMMSSAAAIWQLLPRTSPAKAFPGTYQIQNAASKLLLSVEGDSAANGAAVVQEPLGTSKTAVWKLVPSDNGYYLIKNVKTGLVLNVAAASAAPSAKVVQWPDQGPSYGNDQWLPVKQADGSYVFFNFNSHFALDNPAGSTTAGTGFAQWPASGSTAQQFTLIAQKAE